MAKTREQKKARRKQAPIAVGVLLIAAASIALFWNEWHSAGRTATLRAGEHSVVSLAPDRVPPTPVDSLVHVTGEARAATAVADPLFPVSASVLRLDRRVEMFQWQEHAEGSGSSDSDRVARFEQVWAEGRVPSERFRERAGPVNPPAPRFASERFTATDAALGAFGLAPDLVALLPADEVVPLPPGSELFVSGVALRGIGGYFTSVGPGGPAIGDVRVSFVTVPAGEITVLAGLDGGTLRPWHAPGGEPFAIVVPGTREARALLLGAFRETSMQSWSIRAAATLGMFVGFSILLGPLARRMPQLAELEARSSRRRLAFMAALVTALAVAGPAWLAFRPQASLVLIPVGIAVVVILRLRRRHKPAPTA